MNRSVATINSPEFINLQPLDINPLMSSCEIKVLYIGENRNHSYITKEVATDMAKTLRGAPIVGYYRKDAEDFGDHGQRVTIDADGVKFECLTKPYGFVAPDAKVWFQEFEDINSFGESTIREYLMTTGYLWTGQFEECKSAVEGEGKPHSMELDEATLKGHWETNSKGMDFFIINDAIFSKLCILGEDVEPCFEGSSITAPNVSASFAKVDTDFTQTLFTMMQDLKAALEGGQQMDNNVTEGMETPVVEEPVATPVVGDPAPVVEGSTSVESSFVASEDPETPVIEPNSDPVEPEFKKKDDEDEKKKPESENDEGKNNDDEDEDKKKKYELLVEENASLRAQLEELQTNFSNLESAHAELVEFKRQIDDAKKDEMIGKFYMLEDEDKQDVIANKTKYSLEEIEEKLSVIYFRKKVKIDLENNSKNNENTEVPAVTFNVSNVSEASKPDWLIAVDNAKHK